jgi:fatty-acid desaturase
MELQDLEKRQAEKNEVNWITAIFMALFHVGAVAALFFFTWKALFVAMVLWWISGSLGIGMSYHRLLTHRGYKTSKWVEYFLTLCATLALEGGPIFWVATHRIHHQPQIKGRRIAERQQVVAQWMILAASPCTTTRPRWRVTTRPRQRQFTSYSPISL